jgi:hypothetical protein
MSHSDIIDFIKIILPVISWVLLGIVLIQLSRLAYEIIKRVRFRIRLEKIQPTAKNVFEALGLTPWRIITVRKLGALFFTLSIAVGLFGYLNQYGGLYQPSPIVADFYAGISTDLASIAITILIIDYISEKRADEQLKAQLIREMAGSNNGIALRAINELRARGWLQDGSLRGKIFDGVNWQGADLNDADLQGATFLNANISYANLNHTDLRKSTLINVNLYSTNFYEANLEGVNSIDETMFLLAELAFTTLDKMVGAIMRNGKRYDGRYNLKGDLYIAKEWNVRNLDIETDNGMAEFYKVSLDEYLEGQKWAKENLPKFIEMRSKSEAKNLQSKSNNTQNQISNYTTTILGVFGLIYSTVLAFIWLFNKHKKK